MGQNNLGDLSKMLGNRKAMEQVARSADAQALGELLTRGHNSDELEKMAQGALSGDPSAIQSLIRSITESSEGTELLRRLSESFHGN